MEFEDEPEDAVTEGDIPDDEIDWDQVIALQGAYDLIYLIEDEAERLEAARRLVSEIDG